MNADIEVRQRRMAEILAIAPVVAVVVVADLRHAVPLARALCSGGIRAIEITLRTPVALDAIRAISAEVEDAVVGAGTVLTLADLQACQAAGAAFAVSPGHTPNLLAAAADCALPYLPGAVTASEVMHLAERGYRHQKYYPAATSGGTDGLRAISGPLPHIGFCATGGITTATAAEWLALPNVRAVGGSWLTPPALLQAQDWAAISALARNAAKAREFRH